MKLKKNKKIDEYEFILEIKQKFPSISLEKNNNFQSISEKYKVNEYAQVQKARNYDVINEKSNEYNLMFKKRPLIKAILLIIFCISFFFSSCCIFVFYIKVV